MEPSPLIPLLASALAFGAVLLAGLAVISSRRQAERAARMSGKIARVMGMAPAQAGAPALNQLVGRLAGRLTEAFRHLGRMAGPAGDAPGGQDQTRLDLMRAGFRGPNAGATFHGAKAALCLLPPALFLGVCLLLPKAPPANALVVGALALALMGSYAPNMWLRGKVAERRTQLLCELPDALDLLVVCVEAGMGLDQAINRVSTELARSAPGVSGELRAMTLAMRAGRQRQQALKDLAERTGLEDVQSLVTLLIQADLFGISVARTLRVYSDTLRTGRFQRAEERAAKLPTKLLFPLILCIFPALFAVIIGPAAIQLMHVFTRIGQQ